MKIIKCNLCDSQKFELLYIKNKFEVVKCKNCGLVFVKNQPNSSILQNEYYDKDYYQGKVYKNYLKEANKRIEGFKERIKVIDKLYPQKGKLLDVGCAFGFFLQIAKENGWDVCGHC
jgi:2-polyprenyl-3-methyl-5-hydroxy-6-metoxy-1,4-benzoquinol methylase